MPLRHYSLYPLGILELCLVVFVFTLDCLPYKLIQFNLAIQSQKVLAAPLLMSYSVQIHIVYDVT